MKRFLLMPMLALLLMLPLSTAIAGGGAGPSKDIMKGIFLQVDEAAGSVVFLKDGTEKPVTLTLGHGLTAADIKLDKKVMVSLNKEAGEGVIKDISIMFMDMTPGKIIALIVVGLIGGLLSGFIGSGGAFVLDPGHDVAGRARRGGGGQQYVPQIPQGHGRDLQAFQIRSGRSQTGAVMAVTAIIGVQIGIMIQKYILNHWGNAGSNLYVSVIFVDRSGPGRRLRLLRRLQARQGRRRWTPDFRSGPALQKLEMPPMMHFKVAKVRISAWVTVPVGLATGMLAATIAVGGFIGVPGMIYVIGASAVVASATELVIAFIMGAWGSIQWGLSGLIDIRMTLLILAGIPDRRPARRPWHHLCQGLYDQDRHGRHHADRCRSAAAPRSRAIWPISGCAAQLEPRTGLIAG